MAEDTTKRMGNVIRIDEGEIRGHLTELVKGTVEETLNAMLDAEADAMCHAQRYGAASQGDSTTQQGSRCISGWEVCSDAQCGSPQARLGYPMGYTEIHGYGFTFRSSIFRSRGECLNGNRSHPRKNKSAKDF